MLSCLCSELYRLSCLLLFSSVCYASPPPLFTLALVAHLECSCFPQIPVQSDTWMWTVRPCRVLPVVFGLRESLMGFLFRSPERMFVTLVLQKLPWLLLGYQCVVLRRLLKSLDGVMTQHCLFSDQLIWDSFFATRSIRTSRSWCDSHDVYMHSKVGLCS